MAELANIPECPGNATEEVSPSSDGKAKHKRESTAEKISLTDKEKMFQLFKGLTLAAFEDKWKSSSVEILKDDSLNPNMISDLESLTVSDKMYCTSCDRNFDDRLQQTSHYKTDWHRYNLKRKIKGLSPLSQDSFEKLMGSDISSISGSESSSEEEGDSERSKLKSLPKRLEDVSKSSDSDDGDMSWHIEGAGRRHPRIFVRNDKKQLLSLYRCVVHSKKNQPTESEALLSLVADMPRCTKWAILMTSSGHFAAAIFDGDTVVVHKTFHRYTVRAKRGTAQSLKDSQGNAPHSAGASLRRYNEAALNQEVSDLIKSWADHMKTCDRIFLRAPSFNRAMFFSGKNPPLNSKDPRISMIPFQTRRPTFSELKRVHEILATVECYGTETSFTDHVQPLPKPKFSPKKSRQAEPQLDKAKPQQDDSSSESEEEVTGPTYLDGQEEIVGTGNLKSFECTKKRRRRKKKTEKDSKSETQPKVESTVDNEDKLTDEEFKYRNELYTACKLGNFERAQELLQPLLSLENSNKIQTTSTDESKEVISGEHAASLENTDEANSVNSDSNKLRTDLVISSVARHELTNLAFGENRRTLLCVAAAQNHPRIVEVLLEAGADPTICDSQGRPPYLIASEKPTRNEFRKFMAKYPERYDYTSSQIPAPLTEEMEAARKAKEAERKKAAKKAKKERLKDKKAEEAVQAKEKLEQERYLKLSDREKRALAAERRLTSQLKSQQQDVPVLSRCWQCGKDITGLVPFEYFDYKFCSPKCLKDHKISQKKS